MFLLQEVAYAAGKTNTGSSWMSMVPLILMILIFYLILIRPTQKKEKERMKMIDALKKGDKVLTSSGIIGVVTNVKKEENIITLKIADNVKVDFVKSAIQQKL